MFDELFPRTAFHFDTSALDGDEWLSGLEDGQAQLRWSLALMGDELLRSCASFHGEGNLFASPRFAGKHQLFRRELAVAQRRKVKDGISTNEKAEWKDFLDFRLTDELLSELDEWKPKPAEIWAEVDGAIASGYRLTLSYNPRTHLASCTLICDDALKSWGGYALSSSDEDGALALKMAVFKHIKLNRDWSSLVDQPRPRGRRG